MTVRTRKEIVSFDRPFALNGLDGLRPAGSYEVEIDEQLVEGVSFPAYRRLATWIRLPTKPGYPGVTEILNVDPGELDAALIRDAVPTTAPPPNAAMGSEGTRGRNPS